LFTLVYTYYGGLRAVIWIDVVQMFIYIFGGIAALVVLLANLPEGWASIAGAAEAADKMRILHFDGGFADPRWLFTGVIGGAFLSMASHGADHIIVQRLLASPSLRDARLALVLSGVIVLAQFALFLVVGLGLHAFYAGQTFATPDEIFPRFIVEQLPPGVSGLVIAGILAAAMSTVASSASSLNSLASATTLDIYAPLSRRKDDQEHLMRAGKTFTLMWAVILIGGAMLFQLVQQGTPVVVIALQIASFTYGGLLGGFLLGVLDRRAQQRDALLGMSVTIVAMTLLWAAQQFGVMPKVVDTLWFALIGSVVTLVVGGRALGIVAWGGIGNGGGPPSASIQFPRPRVPTQYPNPRPDPTHSQLPMP
jgi:Na+/proline symporter